MPVAYEGYPFLDIDPLMKLNIWNKGIMVEGYDPALFRKDICGCWMNFEEHALETEYGWEIDHILPRSLRGMSYIANLQPAQTAVVRALCEVIRRAAPEARVSIKWANAEIRLRIS